MLSPANVEGRLKNEGFHLNGRTVDRALHRRRVVSSEAYLNLKAYTTANRTPPHLPYDHPFSHLKREGEGGLGSVTSRKGIEGMH